MLVVVAEGGRRLHPGAPALEDEGAEDDADEGGGGHDDDRHDLSEHQNVSIHEGLSGGWRRIRGEEGRSCDEADVAARIQRKRRLARRPLGAPVMHPSARTLMLTERQECDLKAN